MNKIINKFFIDWRELYTRITTETARIYLWTLWTYLLYGPFSKHRERLQKFRETCNIYDLWRNELDKACFSHDAAYSDSNDLAKKTI